MSAETLPPPIKPGSYMLSTEVDGAKWLGREWSELDYNYGAKGIKVVRSYQMVTRRFVQNNSGVVLIPGYLVVLDPTGTLAQGYTSLGSAGPTDRGVGVDEWIVGTVPALAYFWVTIKGPFLALVSATAGVESSIAAGTPLIAATAAASTTSTTAGRVAALAGATSIYGTDLAKSNMVAISAVTTAQTNNALLVEFGQLFK